MLPGTTVKVFKEADQSHTRDDVEKSFEKLKTRKPPGLKGRARENVSSKGNAEHYHLARMFKAFLNTRRVRIF